MSARVGLAAVISNMGLVHAVGVHGKTKCGIVLRASWMPTVVRDWPSEPNVCRSCDDVVMLRGRRAGE